MPVAAVNAAAVNVTGMRRERRRAAYFAAGLAVVAVALSPPLDGAAARRFSVHMAQHVLLILAAAPLLVAARPGALVMESLPVPARARLGRTLHRPGWRLARRLVTNPMVALTVAVGGFWAWHLPRLYEAALHHDAVHGLEHVTFLAGGFLFWTIVLDPGPKRRLGLGATCGFVFAAMLTNIWLSAALAFATTPLYAHYAAHGVNAALADQQLAGVIMWVPADVVYFITLLALFRRLLRDVGARRLRREAAIAAEAAEAAALLGVER